MPIDSASPDVIDGTRDDVKHYVRLYFRPKTPTQFRMEGIRPRGQLWQEHVHCPVPIFFLFDSADVLTRKDCECTDGNPASWSRVCRQGSTADFLNSLPFKKIYHVGAYDPETHPEIKFHRNAEVIIPERLNLSALKYLVCRSPAEKETLLTLLPGPIRADYRDSVVVATRAQLYFKRWTFVEGVTLDSQSIVIHFSPDSETPGPFLAQFRLDDLETGEQSPLEIDDFDIGEQSAHFAIKIRKRAHYRFRIELDGHPAYVNEYHERHGLPL
jgi:hypothetical protein